MLPLLIVSSTFFEVSDFLNNYGCEKVSNYQYRVNSNPEIHFLITGMGIANMTLQLSRFLNAHQVSGAINIGFCGSFTTKFPLGTIVQISSDCFAELGTLCEDNSIRFFNENTTDASLTANLNMFVQPNKLMNIKFANLPKAKGITVSSCTDNTSRATFYKTQLDAEIETMEGAAFYLCCNAFGIPCVQVRAVSNFIPSGGKTGWDVQKAKLAIANALQEITQKM